MNTKQIIRLGAVFGVLAVGIGAFGAHGLAPLLEQHGRTETFETAVKYHFYHALAIFLAGLASHLFPQTDRFKTAVFLFSIGIVIFSGSLYVLSLTGVSWLGAVTPLGGVAFVLGWLWVFGGASKIG